MALEQDRMNDVSEERFKEILDEVSSESCEGEYCFFRRFLESMHPDPRVLLQFKCIEIFKWSESEKEGEDIGWNEAGLRWATYGYAASFREVFDPSLTPSEIYHLTLSHRKTP
jgi:hypothetical protein